MAQQHERLKNASFKGRFNKKISYENVIKDNKNMLNVQRQHILSLERALKGWVRVIQQPL